MATTVMAVTTMITTRCAEITASWTPRNSMSIRRTPSWKNRKLSSELPAPNQVCSERGDVPCQRPRMVRITSATPRVAITTTCTDRPRSGA